ncbi:MULTISPECIES: hypothetical protein [unclassified Chryseobacterium]|uniref:hypothetical protein n=1 Tax=unclassified Chryseobacterium TaxID=2593645 RepID=UPI00300F913E
MRKKIILRLLLLTAFMSLLWSCRSEDFLPQETPAGSSAQTSAKYASRSFWKEDEVYINKVQQVFLKIANPEHVRSKYGDLHWDYAMSFGNFNETYLLVPITKNNKVVVLMEAVRRGDRLFLYEKDSKDLIEFFNLVIYSKVTQYGEKMNEKGDTASKTSAFVCTTKWITIGCSDGEPNCVPYTTHVTNCVLQGGGVPPKTFDPIGLDGGGGGDDDGYEYPDPPELNPCVKIKSKFENAKFKEKIAAIDKPEVFNYDHEMGYAAGYPPPNTGITETQYQPMENGLGTHNVILPEGDQYFGFIHSHNNESNGGDPVKIFSPGDLATFLTSCVANADTHGNIADAYAMVITSEGNYILQFTGLSSGFGIGPNTIKFWNKWYDREMGKLILENEVTQSNVEKVFLRFLKEKVQIDNIELFQVEKLTGNAKRLDLDTSNNVIPTPCPQI